MKQLLERLSNAHGVAGREGGIYEILRKELRPHVDRIEKDAMGNLIAVREGGPFSFMLAAHMDEIGMMVKYVDEKGFVRFVPLGGWYAPTLYNQRVVLHGSRGMIYGVIGGKPPHVMEEEERKKPVKMEEMFIDIGAKDAEEAKAMGAETGTPITIDRTFCSLGGTRVTGKAFDNRAGIAVLVSTMQRVETEHTVYAVCTVQEEVGLKGAKTSAFNLDPSCAIALDVTIPGDHPGIEKRHSAIEMGKGPSITIIDSAGRGLISSPAMVEWLRRTAENIGIPVQMEVGAGGTTDATAIHLTKGGIPSVTLSIPARYIHSPVEVVDLVDMEYAVELLAKAMMRKPDL